MPPQSNAERQQAFRARRLLQGETEVRGIYLRPELHAKLREYARKMVEPTSPASRRPTAPRHSPKT